MKKIKKPKVKKLKSVRYESEDNWRKDKEKKHRR
jgi:hypothetical protein